MEYVRGGLLEFKANDTAELEEGQFTGYASTFKNEDLQGDIVMPGAFARSLKANKGKVSVLMAHKSDQPVGVGIAAEEDSRGLKVLAEFTLTSDPGRNAYESTKHHLKRGHKLGLSIGYYIAEGGAVWDEKRGVRLLKDIELMEYSIAPTPANPQARITGVKSMNGFSIREVEVMLREGGLTAKEAQAVLASGFEGLQTTHAGKGRDGSELAHRDDVITNLIARDGGILADQLRAAWLGR